MDNGKEPTPREEADAEELYFGIDVAQPKPQLGGLDWPYTIFDLVPDADERFQ